ncbi:MAG TPA: alpha/beta hydrolase [Spirochaetota bacterium]|nr:alpha/beta hydrolase [Spirochaetota bacterium]
MMISLAHIFRDRVIIGIHGLQNKPSRKTLEKWWKQAIREGLARIGHEKHFFAFTLVYWAGYFYNAPLDPGVTDSSNPLFLEDPYVPGPLKPVKVPPSDFKRKVLDRLEEKIDNIFFREDSFINFESISKFIIKSLFRDLDVYYHKNCVADSRNNLCARDALRKELADVIRQYRKKKILLIAHSMGSIIAYDVLTREVPDVEIEYFLTIGSPLGLPVIMKKIFEEQGLDFRKEKTVPAPENIRRGWYNFSDLDDPVAVNYNLADDFRENSRGIGPVDAVVYNDYKYGKIRDRHKSYGYLRAPEVAEILHLFLSEKRGMISSMAGGIYKTIRYLTGKK